MDHACRWIDELAPWLTYVNLYFQGEPLLHPKLDQLMAQCHRHGIYSSTSTNAHHLTEAKYQALIDAGLSRLIVSIDGLTQETYASYRVGGTLSKVMEGTRNMVEAKRQRGRGPHLVWQFLVVGPNEHELPDLLEAASACGVDEVEIKTAQLDDPQDGTPCSPNCRTPTVRPRPDHGAMDVAQCLGRRVLAHVARCRPHLGWPGGLLAWRKDAHHVMVNSGTKAWPRFGTTKPTRRSGAPCLQTVPAFRCAPIAARAPTSTPDPRTWSGVPSTV